MHYMIAGGTGFIGQALTAHYLNAGIAVSIISRDKNVVHKLYAKQVKALSWEDLSTLDLDILQNTDLIINLAGANLTTARWTRKRCQELTDSRLQTTTTLANLCAKLGKDAPPLFNASGVGIYGFQPHTTQGLTPTYDEQSPLAADTSHFLSLLGRAWEHATHHAREASVRVVNLRLGMVLDGNGGAFPSLRRPFNYYVGTQWGKGLISWISLIDLIRSIDFLIARPEIEGPVNLVAPQCVTHKEFAQTLGNLLNRSVWLKLPPAFLTLLFGKMAQELLLEGQHVIPQRLIEAGFNFQHPTLEKALKQCLHLTTAYDNNISL